jgi:hypothetical protein
MEMLNSLYKWYLKIDALSLRILGLIPSGPIALDASRILSKHVDDQRLHHPTQFVSHKKILNNSHFALLS